MKPGGASDAVSFCVMPVSMSSTGPLVTSASLVSRAPPSWVSSISTSPPAAVDASSRTLSDSAPGMAACLGPGAAQLYLCALCFLGVATACASSARG